MEGFLAKFTEISQKENAKFVFCAVAASIVTASAILGVQYTAKQTKAEKSRQETIRNASLEHEHVRLTPFGGQVHEKEAISEDIIREQLSRNYIFFEEEGMQLIRRSFVVIVGVGGVGSWATVMLVRSGVGRVRIIDFDQVTLSSLNRHAAAALEDVGTSKVNCLKKYLHKVAPWVEIEARNELFRKEEADDLLEPWYSENSTSQPPSFVIDAIDNIETKADLLAYCHSNKIPVIASMGAGCKSDPTRIFISDISETTEDPLSRATRRHLRLRGIKHGIPTVYSTEKPGQAQLQPLEEDKVGAAGEYAILPDFRSRILPVLGTMPAIFGLTISTYILCSLAKYPLTPITHKSRKSLYESAMRELNHVFLKLSPSERTGVPITTNDLGFLIDELCMGRSCLPPHFPQRLTVVPWLREARIELANVLVVTKEEAKKHVQSVLIEGRPITEVYTKSELESIQKFMARFKELQKYREG